MQEIYTLEDLRHWSAVTAAESVPLGVGVLGDPVAHSASPPMHNAALAYCDIPLRYVRLHIHLEELAEAFRLLPGCGFIGVNCTIPHKAAALRLVDKVDNHARRIGAINTVSIEEGCLAGYNTDGPGLVRALQAEFGVELGKMRALILGAGGGAGRAVAVQCALEGCPSLMLVNRTLEKAQTVASELLALGAAPGSTGKLAKITAVPWETDALHRALLEVDLIVNCTSLGMKPGDPPPLPPELLSPHLLVYDTIYTARKTALTAAAEAADAQAANGLSMLLYQGALAFETWFRREAPIEVMRAALTAHVAQL